MGFSLTGSQVVFFVASVIVAGAVSGIFVAVIMDIMEGYKNQGKRIQDRLDIEFKIISDPDNIPIENEYYLFYLKNIGHKEIPTDNTTFTIFIDGKLISTDKYSFSNSILYIDEVTTLYIESSEINSGNHKLRIIGPYEIYDEFLFKI